MNQHPVRQGVLGLIGGAIALIVLTALLTAAVESSSADDRLGAAITKLDEATEQLDMVRTKQAQLQAELDARQRGTVAAREDAVERDAELRRQLRVLTLFLRRQGYVVPQLAPRSGENRPKVATPSTSPGTPTPTAPSPRSPESLTCQLVPALCNFGITLPPLLPKE